MSDFEENIHDPALFCSWSGGKDSCLALYFAMMHGGKPQALLTMLCEDGNSSRSHGLPKTVLEEQASHIGIPIFFRSANWDHYEEEFISVLHEFKNSGINTGVFGDIDVEEHREWVTRVCRVTGITPIFPLWKRNRKELLDEFLRLGFKAQIVVINNKMLDAKFLGRQIDNQIIDEFEKAGIDPSGELGEYHTVVTEGPIFSARIEIKETAQYRNGDYYFSSVELK